MSQAALSDHPTHPNTPVFCLPQPYPFLRIAIVAKALGIMSACPTRALPPLRPPLPIPMTSPQLLS